MEGKLSLLLILERNQSIRMIDIFEPLLQSCDIRAVSFLHDLPSSTFVTDIPLQTFVEDEHVPGYLRGMEEELAKADVIIASGLDETATFQAFRYAHHHSKPFFVFCYNEGSLKNYMTQKGPEFQDCIEKASGFIVYDRNVAEHLEFLGVPEERILTLSPRILTGRYTSQPRLGEKFRKYVQVREDDFLVVCEDGENTAGLMLLKAFQKWMEAFPAEASRVRLLICGLNRSKESVKYLAVDLGLSKSVLFINQDTRPFLIDLMSAADLQFSWPESERSMTHAFQVLEGMACGARPLTNKKHLLAGSLPELALIEESSVESIQQSLRNAFLAWASGQIERRQFVSIVDKNYHARDARTVIDAFLMERIGDRLSSGPWNRDFGSRYAELAAQAPVDLEAFLVAVDNELTTWAHRPDHRGKLQLLKAQSLLKQGIMDEAMSCFELCTADESVHREAYMGLARIAYLTHASEEALSFYRKALAIKPNDAEAMAGLGQVYRRCSMADDAVFWFGKSLSVDIENNRTLMALTQACLESEQLDRSITLLEQLKVLIGNKPSLIMTLGQLYYRVGENEKGRELVDLAMQISAEQAGTPLLPPPSHSS